MVFKIFIFLICARCVVSVDDNEAKVISDIEDSETITTDIETSIDEVNPVPQGGQAFTSTEDTVVGNNSLQNVPRFSPMRLVEQTVSKIEDTIVENPITNVIVKLKDHITAVNPIRNLINSTVYQTNEMIMKIIYEALVIYEKTNIQIPLLKEIIRDFSIVNNLNHLFRRKIVSPVQKTAICVASAAVSEYFLRRSRIDLSRNLLVSVIVYVCTFLNIESEEVCRGVIELNIDILIYVVKEKKDLTAFQLSAIVFQRFECFKSHRPKWTIELPDGVSPVRPNQNSGHFYRVLQLTDLHMNPLYKVGTSTVCNEPLCCQNHHPQATKIEDRAGLWSDYNNCDMPYHALENFLNHVVKQNRNLNTKFRYVYFTGDIISHLIWNTSRESNTKEIRRVYRMFREKFTDLQVYPILGNHEPSPLNVFSPLHITNELATSTWLFHLVAEEWSQWLTVDALKTIRKGGYYTVLDKPGFRIVALNSNVCYTFNWWLLYDPKDPFGQLEWLVKVLKDAEDANESVHILSHVPSGDPECLEEWTHQYGRIVERFSNTITGQFNGHTHYDEFRAFFKDKTDVISVAYNGGSFTTYDGLNPNYRIYDVDSESHDLLDFQQWTYDLEEANRNKVPNWYKLYNFRSAYNVTSLKPSGIQGLLVRMKDDLTIMQQYYKFKVRNARPSMIKGCEEDCHNENLCIIVSTEVDEATDCSKFLNFNV